MRRFVIAVLSLLVLATSGEGRAEDMLIVANRAVPPKSWQDGETPRGFAVDVAKEVLEKAGFTPKVELYPFQRALELVKSDKAVLTGTFFTKERTDILVFSEPMFQDEVLLVVQKGKEFPFNGAADLAGKRIGHQDGTIYGPLFTAAMGTFTPDTDNDPAARIKKLVSGRVDAIILNPGFGAVRYHASRAGIDVSELSVLPTPVDRPTIHMALAKTPENEAKMAKINEAIKDLRASGRIDEIVKSYD
jgi:polar amino acid transport system substrate-binding protein